MNTDTYTNASLNGTLSNTLSSLYNRASDGDNVSSRIAAVWTVGAQMPKSWGYAGPVIPSTPTMRLRLWALLLWTVVALDRISLQNRTVRWNAEHVTFVPTPEDTDGTVYDDASDEILADGSCWTDTRPERLKPMTEAAAHRQMRKWKKAHDSEVISDGAFADAIGPWTHEFEIDGELIRLGYQGNDGRQRCPEQGCDTVLDHEGNCPDCGYSTIWTEEVKSDTEWTRYLDSLDRRIVIAYKKAYDSERRDRLGAIIRWIGNADVERIPAARTKFYKRVVASRKQCAATGLWFHSYLTKDQVDVVFAAIEWRLDGGTL